MKKDLKIMVFKWCPGADLNHRHEDFQSTALVQIYVGISRMFEKGLNVPEVASISGHKTASQLFRYVQVNARL